MYMKNLVTRLGIVPSTILATVTSIIITLIVSAAIVGLYGTSFRISELATAIVVPLLLVPFPVYFALIAQTRLDVTEETLSALADTDPLTSAFNRRHFVELADTELASAQRYNENLSILLFDIDNFRQINETHGHPIGDYVLRTLCEICRSQMRKSDLLARLGNDEFACLLSHTFNSGAIEFAERLRTIINATSVSINNHQIQFTISVGVKTADEKDNLDDILHQAFQALTAAKSQGRNKTVSADSLPKQTI